MPPPRRENTIAQIANAAGGLGSAIWDFLTLIITLLPKMGARVANILAIVVMVFVAIYIFISRGFGDYLVRATQMEVIGFIFPNSSNVVKESNGGESRSRDDSGWYLSSRNEGGVGGCEERSKERLTEFPKRTHRNLTEAEKVVLAEGNSDEMIRVNKEKFDYSGVSVKDLPKAEKWYMATQPFWSQSTAYNQWRIWNVAQTKEGKDIEGYKGGLIIEKATGKSAESPEWESEDEEVTEEVTVAMAAVRVEQRRQGEVRQGVS